jgi:alkylated DNA repair dioxygenase AlkB
MKGAENLLAQNGEAFYYPNFFSREEDYHYFSSLKRNIQWRSEAIKMFGKSVMQPRLTAWYGDAGKHYTYSGITMQPCQWTEELINIKEKIENFCEATFNSVLLNFYRTGNDSMGWHSDDERELGDNPVIASVSFGAPRLMKFKHKTLKNLKTGQLLAGGSLLLMQGCMQHFWYHAIPKTARCTGERINLTFRKIID